jgi:putative phosphonate metabolism protein
MSAMNEPRYAIYFVPPASSTLYRFGAGFLGYDCYTGESLGHPPDIALTASEWEELTREPRKYGFHATFKAPFHLLPPFTQADLAADLERFAAIPRTLPVIEPAIQSLARFIAVVAVEPSMALDRLAADGVMAFDRFRRPLILREREQRLGAGLSERQIENLDRWGYPYVFEDFRFHMTLTGPIDIDRRRSILALLQARFNDINGEQSLPIAQLALVRQDARSTSFRIVGQAALTAARLGP